MLKLQNVTITRGVNVLIKKLDLAVFNKQIIGVVGANGAGKSTLFSVIRGDMEPDGGDVNFAKNTRVQSLEQETPGLDMAALKYVLSGDQALFTVLTKLEKAEIENDVDVIIRCHHQLDIMNGYNAEARAAKILAGLGFANEVIENPVKSFSGGWRVRLNLAKCLFSPSDLLLLDEPTNHLDMETIIWLENFLKLYPGGILLVSHDRDFLDRIVTHIAHIDNQQLKVYTGNYSNFEIERSNALLLQQALYKKQQLKLNQMMDFVARFKAKASKAKQAQSRLKAIEKMELITPVYEKSPFTFSFKEPEVIPNPMITMNRVSLGYEEHIILRDINLSIAAKQRVGLLGINGAGKSTLIKGVCGELLALTGKMEIFPKTKIGYFAQHQIDYLSPDETPFSILRDIAKSTSEKELISYLASFNFGRDKSLTPIKYFSGGEKSRVALALIIWQKPNLLLLDEPTNHIDLEVRQALIFALEQYSGSLILVSHDRYLLRTLVDELLLVENGRVIHFDGSVEDYQTKYGG